MDENKNIPKIEENKKEQAIIRVSYNSLYKFGFFAISLILVIMFFSSFNNNASASISNTLTGNVVNDISKASVSDNKQEITMNVDYSGWNPKIFSLKKGVLVKWIINGNELTGCNSRIIVNDYKLDIKLKDGKNVVEFTPDENGIVKWSCAMGMLKGTFIVSDTGEATTEQINSASAQSAGGTCGGSGGGCGCGG